MYYFLPLKNIKYLLKIGMFTFLVCGLVTLFVALLDGTASRSQTAIAPLPSSEFPVTVPPPLSTPPKSPLSDVAVIWYANFEGGHESRGFVEESINFLVPLAKLVRNLGWWSGTTISDLMANQYFLDAKKIDQKDLKELFITGARIMNNVAHRDFISVVFDQPSQYRRLFEETRLKHSIYKIGRAMFETDWIPNGWEYAINEYLDELWVPSAFAKEVFQSAGVHRPIHVINEGFDADMFEVDIGNTDKTAWRQELFPRCRPDDVIYLTVGKMERRKGIDILVNAFKDEFKHNENVCLYIRSKMTKDQQRMLKKLNRQGIRIHDLEQLTNVELLLAYKTADVFALVTHGEGWGRPLMEAMASGLPVVTTLWSGQTEFVHPDYSIPINVTALESAYPDESWAIGGQKYKALHHWAHIEIKDVRRALRWCLTNRQVLPGLGAKARRAMYNRFTREKVAVTAEHRLTQIRTQIRDEGVQMYRDRSRDLIRLHDKERDEDNGRAVLARLFVNFKLEEKLTALVKSNVGMNERLRRIAAIVNTVYEKDLIPDDNWEGFKNEDVKPVKKDLVGGDVVNDVMPEQEKSDRNVDEEPIESNDVDKIVGSNDEKDLDINKELNIIPVQTIKPNNPTKLPDGLKDSRVNPTVLKH